MDDLSPLEKTKKITQSYLLTKAKYNFTIVEKRIFYRIIELLQILYEGKSMKELMSDKFEIDTNLFGEQVFRIPASKVFTDEGNNYTLIKKSFHSLMRKYISIEDDKRLELFNIFSSAKYHRETAVMEFVPTKEILLTFEYVAQSWKRYELSAAFQFKSTYTMRFFEMFCEQKAPINFTIAEIKHWFDIEKKYSTNYEFFRNVIDVAQKELKDLAPVFFTYEKHKSPGSRSFTYIRFIIHDNPKNVTDSPELRNLYDFLPEELILYLTKRFYFTNSGMLNVVDHLIKAHKEYKWDENKYEEIRAKATASKARNLPGYLITSIKNEGEALTKESPKYHAPKDMKNVLKK